MKNSLIFIQILMIAAVFTSCNFWQQDFRHQERLRKDKYLIIQPINTTKNIHNRTILDKIEEDFGISKVVIAETKTPPEKAVNYEKGFRYSASYLLDWLMEQKPDSVALVIGLTDKDIYISKKNKDGNIKSPESKYRVWGIFGLAKCPGASSVISIHRIQSSNKAKYYDRLMKITLHEIGHNLGLKHCENKTCYMTDAVESKSTIDNASLEMCNKCKKLIGAY